MLGFVFPVFISCNGEPRKPHQYNANPVFTVMGVGFFGQYYAHIPYYVFSFTFLSEGMLNEEGTAIVAPGQFLFIEDFFVPKYRLDFLNDVPDDFVLTERKLFELLAGEYKVSGRVGSGNFGSAFSFAPGELFTVDHATYIIGARITYHEPNPAFSARKLITGGSFTVMPDRIKFNIITENGFAINGVYLSPPGAFERKIEVKYEAETRERERF